MLIVIHEHVHVDQGVPDVEVYTACTAVRSCKGGVTTMRSENNHFRNPVFRLSEPLGLGLACVSGHYTLYYMCHVH